MSTDYFKRAKNKELSITLFENEIWLIAGYVQNYILNAYYRTKQQADRYLDGVK